MAAEPEQTEPQVDVDAVDASSLTVEQEDNLMEVVHHYRAINRLLANLSASDEKVFLAMLTRLTQSEPGWFMLRRNADAEFYKSLYMYMQATCRVVEDRMKKADKGTRAQPRWQERDKEIVRLKDEEKLSWQTISERIRANPDWEYSEHRKLSEDGKGRRVRLTKDAVEAAYNNWKKKEARERSVKKNRSLLKLFSDPLFAKELESKLQELEQVGERFHPIVLEVLSDKARRPTS